MPNNLSIRPDFKAKILWQPDMDDQDLQAEIESAMTRVYFMQSWLDGKLETDVFLDFMDAQHIDVFDLGVAWETQGLII